MTTKKPTTKKTTRRAPKSSDKPKHQGKLSKFPLSPARAKAILMREEAMKAQGLDPRTYRHATKGPKFDFEDVFDACKIPQAAWDAFILDLQETGNVTQSCVNIGIKRVTVYKHAQSYPEFKEAMQAAHSMGLLKLEDVAVIRATEGVDKPVFFQGEVVGYTREYSDQLLQFLLKGNFKKYREGAREETESRGSGVLVVPADVATDDWEAAATKMQSALREEVHK